MKNMKKIFLLLIGLFLLVSLTSCDDTISYDGGVTLSIPKEIEEILVYEGTLPTYKFEYDGSVNVADFSTSTRYLFAKNDFYAFSDNFEKNIIKYETQGINTKVTDQTNDEGEAKFGKDRLPLDEPQTYSKEIMRVIWDDTGARFSFFYRTFVSGGKRYYTTPYTTNVTITMEVPLYVSRESGTNKIYLLNLPYDTKYDVSASLELNKLLEKDEYTNEFYYQFEYPAYLSSHTDQEKVIEIKNWYNKYCSGYEENGTYYFVYLGNTFEVLFDIDVQSEKGFQIKLVK